MFHRGLHDYNENGRSLKIESYIEALSSWVLSKVKTKELVFVDVGCDYGHAMKVHEDRFKKCIGIEPNKGEVVIYPELEIHECSIEDEEFKDLTAEPCMVWLNHVLEHLENPIENLRRINEQENIEYVMLSTPDAILGGSDFVYTRSHVSIYTQEWYRQIGPKLLSNFELIHLKSTTLRKDFYEIWSIYKRKSCENQE